MRKSTIRVSSALILTQLLAPAAAFALVHESGQESGTTISPKQGELRQNMEQKREDDRAMMRETRDVMKKETEEKRGEVRENIQEKRGVMKDEIKMKREEITSEIKAMREKAREEVKIKREEFQKTVKEKRETFKEDAKKRRDELKKSLGDQRAENIERFFSRMTQKFEAALDRLNALANKIEARIKTIEDGGMDVTATRAKFDDARGKISDAQKSLDDAKTSYDAAAQSTDFPARFRTVHTAIENVAQKVREARRALVSVIPLIKGIGNSNGDGASVETTTAAPATSASGSDAQ